MSVEKRYVDRVETFQTFYNEHRDRLFGYLLRKTGSPHLAADIMQESFTRYLERYRDRERSAALLFRISRNLVVDQVRKNRAETVYDDELHGYRSDNPESGFGVREETNRMLAALARLDEEERDLLALVVASGLSYREIAGITGLSEANIKVKIHRTRVRLKMLLKGER